MEQQLQTREELLKQKIKNFIKFLKENIKDKSLVDELDETFQKTPVAVFFEWVINVLKAKDINKYTDELFNKYHIDKNDYADEIIDKFKRYLSCFIYLCS